MRQLHHRQRRRHRLDGAHPGANQLIYPLGCLFGIGRLIHHLKRQLDARRKRRAERRHLTALGILRHARQRQANRGPVRPLHRTRNRPGDRHGTGDGDVGFVRRAGGQPHLLTETLQRRRRQHAAQRRNAHRRAVGDAVVFQRGDRRARFLLAQRQFGTGAENVLVEGVKTVHPADHVAGDQFWHHLAFRFQQRIGQRQRHRGIVGILPGLEVTGG